jgi:chromosome segregation ATPase
LAIDDDEFQESSATVRLIESCDLEPAACRQMLQAAARLSLCTPKDQRHHHQESMISTLIDVLETERASRERAVDEVRMRMVGANAQIAEASNSIKASKDKIAEETDTYSMRLEELEILHQAVSAAETAWTEAIERKDRLPQDHEEDKAHKAELEKSYDDVWHPLKVGALTRRQWQTRDKLIKAFMKIFDGSLFDVEKSLTRRLAQDLTLNAAERSPFAQAAIEFADTLFVRYLSGLAQKISNVHREAARHAALVNGARNAVTAAKAKQATGAKRVGTAQTAVKHAEVAQHRAQEELKNLKLDLGDLEKLLAEKQGKLVNFLEQFEVVRNFMRPPLSAGTSPMHPGQESRFVTPPLRPSRFEPETPEKLALPQRRLAKSIRQAQTKPIKW